jgi:hypothetical protein
MDEIKFRLQYPVELLDKANFTMHRQHAILQNVVHELW